MLIFDKDAVAIEGGFLYEEANGRLETLKNMRLDEEGSDYLYGDLEEQFLNEVETLADIQNSTGYNFGPGGRGEVVYYYCEDPDFVKSRYF